MEILKVTNLTKKYPAFILDNVSFTLEKGKITGFIGRNGAGKSTTLKSLFNFVHPDNGEILFNGLEFTENEFIIKQKVGFVSSGVNYYLNKKIKVITSVTKTFYDDWDDEAYNHYLMMFKLDENKTPSQLSEGMKVKYSLALALSHHADLLILDEPTSGLDPISRDDLLDTFMALCEEGITILFSTHITSDLDKCADNIIYIRNGKIIDEEPINDFINKYRLVELTKEELNESIKPILIGCKRSKNGYSAIVKKADANKLITKEADLEAIMIHLEKEEDENETI